MEAGLARQILERLKKILERVSTPECDQQQLKEAYGKFSRPPPTTSASAANVDV